MLCCNTTFACVPARATCYVVTQSLPAVQLRIVRQSKLIPSGLCCARAKAPNTKRNMPTFRQSNAAVQCVICPDVNIRLMDRAIQSDGPVEREVAALSQHKTGIASVPLLHEICTNMCAHVLLENACSQPSCHRTKKTHPECVEPPREP